MWAKFQTQISHTFVVLLLLGSMSTASQANPPFQITLTPSKSSYLEGETVQFQVRVYNNSGADVITSAGFMDRNFEELIRFVAPDGKIIVSKGLSGGAEPQGPPRFTDAAGNPRDGEFVDIVAPGASTLRVLDDVSLLYAGIGAPGHYTAQLCDAVDTFSVYYPEPISGKNFAFLDDPGRQAYSPLCSNLARFDIVPLVPLVNGSVRVEAKLMQIGTGNKPPVIKGPLARAPVRLIKVSDIPPDITQINHKTYDHIWQRVDPVQSAVTTAEGIANFAGVAKGEYVVIGLYDRSVDARYIGAKVGSDEPEWGTNSAIKKNLNVLIKSDGKQAPGQTKKLTGSELLITYPEYVEWSSEQELYPFVFESVGDWGVATAVVPPEGFVVDQAVLSADVVNSTQSLQFVVTDIGSDWVETDVTFDVKHKGKTQKIHSKIGIALSAKLAAKKGLGRYGHSESPGDLVNGKLVKNPAQPKGPAAKAKAPVSSTPAPANTGKSGR